MPRDGSGTYTQPASTSAVNGAVIDPDKFNTLIADIASALTTSINTSGTKAMAADLSMGSNKITSLTAGVSTADAANMGNVHPTVLAKTANYTVLTTDTGRLVTGDATIASFTLTLPAAASSSGMVIGAKKIDATANTVTFDGNGAETIEGALTFVLSAQYDSVILVCNGTAWYVLPSIPATLTALAIVTATITTANITSAVMASAAFTGSIRATGEITPTTIAADTNDYAPTTASTHSVWRISASSSVKITGIAALAAGTEITLINVGSNNITLTSNDAASTAGNRLNLPYAEVLRPNQSIVLRYDTTLSLWVPKDQIKPVSIAGGFKNLKVTSTVVTTCVITADAITLENTFGEAYRALSVSVTATISSSGANGLDTGAEASSTWYSVWVIYNPTTNTVASLLSTSATAPTMPSGYTFKARVGWARNNASSNILPFIQYGRRVQVIIDGSTLTALPTVTTGSGWNTSTFTAAATGGFVPTTATVIRVVVHSHIDGIEGAPNDQFGAGGETNQAPYNFGVTTSGFVPNGFTFECVLESTNIYFRGTASGSSRIQIFGWDDNI